MYEEGGFIVLWARPFPEALAALRKDHGNNPGSVSSSDCSCSSLRNLPARLFQDAQEGPLLQEKVAKTPDGLS